MAVFSGIVTSSVILLYRFHVKRERITRPLTVTENRLVLLDWALPWRRLQTLCGSPARLPTRRMTWRNIGPSGVFDEKIYNNRFERDGVPPLNRIVSSLNTVSFCHEPAQLSIHCSCSLRCSRRHSKSALHRPILFLRNEEGRAHL